MPTMTFSFVCHTAILPIFAELKRYYRIVNTFSHTKFQWLHKRNEKSCVNFNCSLLLLVLHRLSFRLHDILQLCSIRSSSNLQSFRSTKCVDACGTRLCTDWCHAHTASYPLSGKKLWCWKVLICCSRPEKQSTFWCSHRLTSHGNVTWVSWPACSHFASLWSSMFRTSKKFLDLSVSVGYSRRQFDINCNQMLKNV